MNRSLVMPASGYTWSISSPVASLVVTAKNKPTQVLRCFDPQLLGLIARIRRLSVSKPTKRWGNSLEPQAMERFIHRENLEHYRRLLAQSANGEQRQQILKLLAEEEAKDQQQLKRE